MGRFLFCNTYNRHMKSRDAYDENTVFPAVEARRRRDSRRLEQPARGEQYVALQHRLRSRDPVQYEFCTQPSVGQARPQHAPTAPRQDVINDLSFQNMGGKKFLLHVRSSAEHI
jgi:hypothetical protein